MKAQSQRGILLILAVSVIFVVATISVTLIAVHLAGSKREMSREHKMKSREIAESALDMSIQAMKQATDGVNNDYPMDSEIDEGIYEDDIFLPSVVAQIEGQLGYIGTLGWTLSNDSDGDGMPSFEESGVTPVELMGGEFIAWPIFSENDGIDNNNDGVVDEEEEAGFVIIVARGRFKNYVSTVRYQGSFTETLPQEDPPIWVPGGAVTAGGHLSLKGRPTINGDEGNVHTNGDLDLNGRPFITGIASASGTVDQSGGGNGQGNGQATVEGGILQGDDAPPVPIPSVNPQALRHTADFILAANGKVYDANDNLISDTAVDGAFSGWTSADDKWSFHGSQTTSSTFQPGTYYIVGSAQISGRGPHDDGADPGPPAGGGNSGGGGGPAPGISVEMTVIAEGSIKLSGNSSIFRDTTRTDALLFVAGGDIKISGRTDVGDDTSTGDVWEGIIAAHEQIKISGRAEIHGAIVAEDGDNLYEMPGGSGNGQGSGQGNTSDGSMIPGRPTITFNGNLDTGLPVQPPDWNRWVLNPVFSAYEER
jgi:hypothetical protein